MNNNNYILKWAKKIICINELGGQCVGCGIDNIFVLQFHHKRDKVFDICAQKDSSLYKLLPEVHKCQLLCANCHGEKTQEENGDNVCMWRRKIKQQILDYKDIHSCQSCGYKGGNNASLDLHHRNINSKEFKPIQKAAEFGLTDWVCREIDKCDIICKNCHTEKHIKMEKFKALKKEIFKKVKTHKPKHMLDHSEVLKLFKNGLHGAAIARKMQCSRTAISYILNKCKLVAQDGI